MLVVGGAWLILAVTPSVAQSIQGRFDWSGATSGTVVVDGSTITPPALPISGTATFIYDASTNQGSIEGLPVTYGYTDGSYDFGVYYDLAGKYYALPVSSPDDLNTFQGFLFDGNPVNATLIITPDYVPLYVGTGSGVTTITGGNLGPALGPAGTSEPPAGTYTILKSIDLSAFNWTPLADPSTADSLAGGNLQLQIPDFELESGDGIFSPQFLTFMGSDTNFVATVPEPSSGFLFLLGGAGVFAVWHHRTRGYLMFERK